ncbi:MAG: hypothetical protein RTU63_08635 [Candidatus Thorarchaeota archaeon]
MRKKDSLTKEIRKIEKELVKHSVRSRQEIIREIFESKMHSIGLEPSKDSGDIAVPSTPLSRYLKEKGIPEDKIEAIIAIIARLEEESDEDIMDIIDAAMDSPSDLQSDTTSNVYFQSLDPTDFGGLFKILFLGDNAVGKRKIRNRIDTRGFQSIEGPSIAGVFNLYKFKTKKRKVPDKFVLWSPPPGFGKPGLYKGALSGISGLVLVYDVTRERTFETLSEWLDEALEFSTNFPIAIIGNKIDLRDSVTETINPERGREYAEQVSNELNVPTIFMETSAKTGENIPRLFSELAKMIISKSK